MKEQLDSLRAAMEIYDRVHDELDEGKPYDEIDNGLRKDTGEAPWGYRRWQAYMTQTIMNRARSVLLAEDLENKG